MTRLYSINHLERKLYLYHPKATDAKNNHDTIYNKSITRDKNICQDQMFKLIKLIRTSRSDFTSNDV